ncbi:calcium-binding protein [Caulobacter sp. LjRoot300]|uniref:calcium-binding protein n=1 Tax=Caulobacter sp. LjRoot300 TaxID=3342321 RepID=UPI003ECF0E98
MAYQLGTSASETLTGSADDDYIVGNGGNDTLIGLGGADHLIGYTGADVLDGGDGDDILDGDGGDDQLLGGAGSDRLNGGGGADILNGGDGDDILSLYYDAGNGVPGTNNIDRLTGGAGADRFVVEHYGAGSSASSIDHIVDFSAVEGDRIDLLAPGGVSTYGGKYLVWSGAITRPDFTVAIGQSLDAGIGKGFAQVWTWTNASTTYLIIDIDDNQQIDYADFVLAFDGAITLDAASFVTGTFNSSVGTPNNDVWTGGAAGDVKYGGAGADTLSGAGGNDELHGDDGDDTLNGDDGDDVLLGEFGDDTLHGGAGNDMLYAGGRYNGQDDSQGSVNVLYGDDGNDFLAGSTGQDTMYGGAGDDILSGGAGDKLYGGDGVDNLRIDAGTTAAAAGTLDGGAGDDLIALSATQIATGGTGADRFSLKFMPNSFSPTNPDGYATITDFNAAEGDRLDFSQSYHYQLPVVWRGALDNPAFSLTNGDTFSTSDYGPGFFQIWTWTQGGATYLIVDTNNDGVLQYGVAGPDYVLKFDGPVGLDAGAFPPNFLFTGVNGTSAADTFNGGADTDTYYGVGGDDQLHGGASGDTLYGNTGADQIWGDDGNDSLSGGLGNDQLEGGADADQIWGGGGSDVIHGGEGADMLSGSGTAPGDQDAATDINLIYGEGGDDQISGGGTYDEVYGGDGNDQIYASGFLYGENGDDRLTAALASTLLGGAGNDSLTGGFYDDVLDGGAGADTFQGGSGNDVLRVDLGDATVWSGDGDDVVLIDGLRSGETAILGSTPGVYVNGDYGNDRFVILTDLGAAAVLNLNGGPGGYSSDVYNGHDVLDLSHAAGAVTVDLSLTTGQQTGMGNFLLYQIEDVIAGDHGSTLIGDAGGNVLTGGDGADALLGRDGADILTGGGGGDSLTGGAGADTFRYLAATDSAPNAYDFITDFTTGSDILDLAAVTPIEVSLVTSGAATFVFVNTPNGQMTIAANGQVNGSDMLVHNTHGFYMIGDGAANTLVGGGDGDVIQSGAGDDVIIGGGGGDVIFGQAGADTFKYLTASDSNAAGSDGLFVFETGVDKVDLTAVHPSEVSLIRSGGSTFLFASTPTGPMQLATVGYDLNGRDIITGDGHGFYMIGDSNADTLIGGSTGDVIQANDGNDIIIGGGGGDAIWGGAGADVFTYLAATDSNSAGTDTIFDFQSGVDKLDLTALRTGASDVYGFLNSGGSTFIFVDLHGDGVGDMTIQLNGTAGIVTGDVLF